MCLRFTCSSCGQKLRVDESSAGRICRCAKCGARWLVKVRPTQENKGDNRADKRLDAEVVIRFHSAAHWLGGILLALSAMSWAAGFAMLHCLPVNLCNLDQHVLLLAAVGSGILWGTVGLFVMRKQRWAMWCALVLATLILCGYLLTAVMGVSMTWLGTIAAMIFQQSFKTLTLANQMAKFHIAQ